MLVLKGFLRFLTRFLACRHWRTRIHEGKCYCPDCGRGLIFQWAVLRCTQCHGRVESRLWFGHILPLQRCCVRCGHAQVQTDWLSNPAYFQLHQAQLVLVEEERYADTCLNFRWQVLGQVMGQQFSAAAQTVSVGQAPSSALGMLPCLTAPGV